MSDNKTLCVCDQEVTRTLCVCDQEIDSAIPTKDCAEVFQQLLAWDMTIPKRYMVENEIYRANEVDDIEREYKRFMALAIAYPVRRIPVAKKVDAFWHTHILFTQDYYAMGLALAGGYIHHRPGILDDRSELGAHFEHDTLALYREHFGPPNPTYWAPELQIAQ